MDFDFQAYVQRRTVRSAEEGSSAKQASSYSFGRDRRVLRTLKRTRLVGHAMRATSKLEEKTFRAEILDKSVEASAATHATLLAMGQRAARELEVGLPSLRVISEMKGRLSGVFASFLRSSLTWL